MNSTELEKQRCEVCGHIAWTTQVRGCKNCGSHHLVIFPELPAGWPDDAKGLWHSDFTYDISRMLADSQAASTGAELTHALTMRLAGNLDNLAPGTHLWARISQEVEVVIGDWHRRDIPTIDVLVLCVGIRRTAVSLNERARDTVREVVADWFRANVGTGERDDFVSIVRNGYGPLLSVAHDTTTQIAVDYAVRKLVTDTGGEIKHVVTAEPGHLYARLPFDWHISVSAAAWKLLQNSTYLVPLLVVLTRLELSADALIGAAVIKEIFAAAAKLHEETGELCIYGAIANYKAQHNAWPTLSQVHSELRENTPGRAEKYLACRYRSPEGCSITEDGVTSILGYLENRHVLARPSADTWAITT